MYTENIEIFRMLAEIPAKKRPIVLEMLIVLVTDCINILFEMFGSIK